MVILTIIIACCACVFLRDPVDVVISFYNFLNGWFFEKDEIPMDDFIMDQLCDKNTPTNDISNASYWRYLMSWYPQRLDKNVLWLHYEDLIEDLPGCVDLVAEFLGIGVEDAALKKLVTYQVKY